MEETSIGLTTVIVVAVAAVAILALWLWRRKQEEGKLMADGPPINMFLKADTQNGQIEWDLGQNNPPAHGKAAVTVPKGTSHNIVVHLVGSPGIAFDTNDPVWIQRGGSCPPAPGNGCTDQIDDIQCTPNKLTMHDTNLDKVDMIYQMNFIGAPPCDPEIKNGGR